VSLTAKIDIRGLKDGLTLYRDTITVSGTVRTGKGINDLMVNRESLLHGEEDTAITPFVKLLKEKHGRPLAFSKTIHLDEGDNTITTSLTDTGGEMTRKDLTVTRNIPRVRKISSRLSVAIFPFDERKKIKETLRDYVQTFLNRSFIEQKRFNVLERARLKKTLEQQRIPRETRFDRETAVRLGSHMASATVLIGTIATSEDAIEITAHLVDTETARVMAEKDVYWEGELTGGFRGILDRLALKFKQHIPLCEGSVTQTMPDDVIIDLGTNHAIQQGMKFLAFSEGETRIDPETGMDLGNETDIIGLLSAEEIDQTFSKADVVKKFTGSGIQTGNRVIAQ
jgi:TolB-like protein